MAKFALTHIDLSGFSWQITALSYPWAYTYYYYASVAKQSFTSGSSGLFGPSYGYMPYGGTAYPFGQDTPITSSACYSWVSSASYPSPTPFYIYPWIEEVSTGLKWSVGLNGTIPQGQPAEGVLITPVGTRPPYFYWSYYGTGYSPQDRSYSGGKYYVYRPYSSAWNALRQNIINLLVYKGVIASEEVFSNSSYYYPQVYSGNAITAYQYNKVVNCLNAMGASLPTVTQGSTFCTENYFLRLQIAINNIP